MTKADVVKLFKFIKSIYPTFEVSQEKINIWSSVMKKMDFDRVMVRVNEHVTENKFPPTIAEIAAYPPEKNDHLDKMREWEQEAAKVPESTKQRFKQEMKKLIQEKSK